MALTKPAGFATRTRAVVAADNSTAAMSTPNRGLPAVDTVLRTALAATVVERFGRQATVGAIRAVLAAARAESRTPLGAEAAAAAALAVLERKTRRA